MTAPDALRVSRLCAQAEIALVRRDPVAAPLLSQAARAAAGLPPGEALEVAARMARGLDHAAADPAARAVRKAIQALTRIASQRAEADLLAAG
jgi:hypothetical protein